LLTVQTGSAAFGQVRTNSDFGSTYRVNGGTFSATDVNIRRNSAAAVDFNSGFIVNGGVATVGTIGLGTQNSNGAMTVSGGSLTATGTVTVGNQATGGRGGAMRVIGGTFASTDTVNGIVLARTNGTNANNVAAATFTGGVSTVEKITLGFDATVTAGSATVTINGGTLYLGAGGIVKNGAAGLATALNFSSGALGAKADWSTSLPITLQPAVAPATLFAFKADDATNQPRAIVLNGVLSGTGGFVKTGSGMLRLTAANTFTGGVAIDGGLLQVDGSIGAGAAGQGVAVNGLGVLGGTGAVARDVVLNNSGLIAPGPASAPPSPASTLAASSLLWHGGGRLAFDLSAGHRLVLTGPLTRGAGSSFEVLLSTSAPLPVGAAVSLASYSGTNFVAGEITSSGPAGYRGVFLVEPTELRFLVTGAGPTAEFTHWAFMEGLPEGQRGAGDDPDFDGIPNLLEFVQGLDPLLADGDRVTARTVDVNGERYPAVAFVRRQASGLGGVTTSVLASASTSAQLWFATASLLGTEEVSSTPRSDGLDDVVVRSLTPLAQAPRQFFKLTATIPDQPTPSGSITLASSPVGVMSDQLSRGESGLAFPLIASDAFVGVVVGNANEGTNRVRVEFDASHGAIASRLEPGRQYYAEVVTGALEGERFDVDEGATGSAAAGALVLTLQDGSFSTRPSIATGALAGARIVVRPHVTLSMLTGMFTPGLTGHDNPLRADGVWLFENDSLTFYHLRSDGVRWTRLGGNQDQSARIISPDISVVIDIKSRRQSWLHEGRVRTNAFRKNLQAGLQAFSSGFPVNLSPAQLGAFVNPAQPAATRWTGSNNLLLADQIHVLFGAASPLSIYYLRADGTTWRTLLNPANAANTPIAGATSMLVVRRVKADPAYRVPAPVQ
jgi:autotransporter-associated beta strand protein